MYMVKYKLVCNSSDSTLSFFLNIGTTSANFIALGNVHESIHVCINDCIGLHRKSAPSLINLPGIKSYPVVFLIFIIIILIIWFNH